MRIDAPLALLALNRFVWTLAVYKNCRYGVDRLSNRKCLIIKHVDVLLVTPALEN